VSRLDGVPEESFHERFDRRRSAQPSDCAFGLTFAAFFCVLAVVPILFGGDVRRWALVAGAALALAGLMAPRVLRGPNRAWARVGALANRVAGPVVLGAFYYLVVTPVAAVTRRFGRDALRLRLEPGAETYFVEVPARDPGELRNQF
jgi:hypothetical protein